MSDPRWTNGKGRPKIEGPDDHVAKYFCNGCYQSNANSDGFCPLCQYEEDMKLSKAAYVSELKSQRDDILTRLFKLQAQKIDDVKWFRVAGGPSATGDRIFYVVDTGGLHEDRRIRIHQTMLVAVAGALQAEIDKLDIELKELGVEIDE